MQLLHKYSYYWYLSLALFMIGMLFYGIYNELIIIRLPFKRVGTAIQHDDAQKKIMKLIYWNGDTFASDEKELLFSKNTIRSLNDLITTWLILQEEEQSMPKKVTLQSVLLDAAGTEALLSFDRSPIGKEKSIDQKLRWIEGLLKTIKENNIPIQKIRLLVYAKPLQDTHLDFNHPWPISGYLNP